MISRRLFTVVLSVTACGGIFKFGASRSGRYSFLKDFIVKNDKQIPMAEIERAVEKELLKLEILSLSPSELEALVQEDFVVGNTIMIDGWTLSKTEVARSLWG